MGHEEKAPIETGEKNKREKGNAREGTLQLQHVKSKARPRRLSSVHLPADKAARGDLRKTTGRLRDDVAALRADDDSVRLLLRKIGKKKKVKKQHANKTRRDIE